MFTVTSSFRTAPIHAEAPEFTDMSVEQEILVTGIKVVDLLAPYAKGGKIGQCNKLGHKCHAFCTLKVARCSVCAFSKIILTFYMTPHSWLENTPVESGQTLVV